MASEAVIIELLGDPKGCPIQYICVDADAFPKGTILKLSDNREADLSAAAGNVCAGIAAMEKVALDGSLTISAYTNGIFDLTEANVAAIPVGEGVVIGGANLIRVETAGDAELGKIFGHALATFAKTEAQSVRVLI